MANHGSVSGFDPDQVQAVVDICTALKSSVETAIAATADKIKLDLSTSDKVFAEDCVGKENCEPFIQQVSSLVEVTGITEAFDSFTTIVRETGEKIGMTFKTNANNVADAQQTLAAQVKKAEAAMSQ